MRFLHIAFWLVLPAVARLSAAEELARVPVYSVAELVFQGPTQGPSSTPAWDIDFWVRFRYERSSETVKVCGFWDGDGRGEVTGNVFKVRFCPTTPGRWRLAKVQSNRKELAGQHQGSFVTALPSKLHGFWEVDESSPGRRWYRRSDGSHQYIIGNTHYSFLSGYGPDLKPSGNDIAADLEGNAQFFKKLRFSLVADRYPNRTEKAFFDDQGKPTDDGGFSHRPNPKWFSERADAAVRAGFDRDLITDLILCGPDTEDARSTLRAAHNHGDPTPWLKYVAARYGSFPNVWICLCNEFNIKSPHYSEAEIAHFGQTIRRFLPDPTPLSVHTVPSTLWPVAFDKLPPWNDHQIIQKKIRQLAPAADAIAAAWKDDGQPRTKPTIDDELSYQGAGDKHSEGDTIESHLGAFLGGGYGTTGCKPANKLGQYFWGKFDPAEHTSADNLKFLRQVIDAHITFWKMAPDMSLFAHLNPRFRGMAWPGHEYVLGTDASAKGIMAHLPAGRWTVTRYDLMAKKTKTVATGAAGEFTFDAPTSRAVLFRFKKNPSQP